MTRTPLIIDTDPGVDDALALLMALRAPHAEVLALCSVAGNVDLDRATRNLRRVRAVALRDDAPVHRGAGCALLGDQRDAAGYHGGDGLGDADPAPQDGAGVAAGAAAGAEFGAEFGAGPGTGAGHGPRPADDEPAALAIVRHVRARPGEITLLALGPLTNVALAFALAPDVPGRLARLVVMGGTIRGQGNVTAAAEFNAWCDPEAFARVLRAGAPTAIVSWETTLDHRVPWPDWERWIAGDAPRARFARAITRRMAAFERDRGAPGMPLPDPLAAAVALDPGCVTHAEERHAAVVLEGVARGATIVDERPQAPPPNATIVRRIELGRMEALFRAALGG